MAAVFPCPDRISNLCHHKATGRAVAHLDGMHGPAGPNGRTSITSPGFACGIAIVRVMLSGSQSAGGNPENPFPSTP